jgi:hypothetical protein
MKFETIKIQDKLDRVPEVWAFQYRHYPKNTEPMIKLEKLKNLQKPLKKEEIEEIIGNKSWTELVCSHCLSRENDILVFLEDTDEYGPPAYCKKCIQGALEALNDL